MSQLFAPFVDVALYPTVRLLDAYEAVGQKWFTLAFITADLRTKEPAWGGVVPMWKQYMADQVRNGCAWRAARVLLLGLMHACLCHSC